MLPLLVKPPDLLGQLPAFLQSYEELAAITSAENPEFALLQTGLAALLDNQFVSFTDTAGITRFEQILGITPLDIDTLAERQFRVIVLWIQYTHYTKVVLHRMLSMQIGRAHV